MEEEHHIHEGVERITMLTKNLNWKKGKIAPNLVPSSLESTKVTLASKILLTKSDSCHLVMDIVSKV